MEWVDMTEKMPPFNELVVWAGNRKCRNGDIRTYFDFGTFERVRRRCSFTPQQWLRMLLPKDYHDGNCTSRDAIMTDKCPQNKDCKHYSNGVCTAIVKVNGEYKAMCEIIKQKEGA